MPQDKSNWKKQTRIMIYAVILGGLMTYGSSVSATLLNQPIFDTYYSTTTPNTETGLNLIEYIGRSPATGIINTVRFKGGCSAPYTAYNVTLYKSDDGTFYQDGYGTSTAIYDNFIDETVTVYNLNAPVTYGDYLWLQVVMSSASSPFDCRIYGKTGSGTISSQGNMYGIDVNDTYTNSANQNWNILPVNKLYYQAGLNENLSDPNPQTTQILSTIPANNSINATSTTFSISYQGYLAPTDFNSGSAVTLHLYNNVNRVSYLVGPMFSQMISGQDPFDETYTYSIPDSGTFTPPTEHPNIQTTGDYTMDFTIKKNAENWYNIFDLIKTTVYSTTTTFTVSTTTAYDQMIKDTRQELKEMGQAVATSTSNYCNPISFKWYGCVNAIYMVLFVPSSADFKGYVEDLTENVYTHAPLGYIKRFQDLLATTTIGTLPAVDYTFSTSSRSILSSILGGERIYIDPFQYATGTSITSITSDGANGLPEKNIWEIMAPFYNTVIYLALIIMIISELLGLELITTTGGTRANKGGRLKGDAYKYREKLYQMSQRK